MQLERERERGVDGRMEQRLEKENGGYSTSSMSVDMNEFYRIVNYDVHAGDDDDNNDEDQL